MDPLRCLPPLSIINRLKACRDTHLLKILRQCGAYYHVSDLFYHELLRERLVSIGFRVVKIEKLWLHHVYDVRVFTSLAAQMYLLVTRPVPKRYLGREDLLLKQFRSELQDIARDLGEPIKVDCITVSRRGAYLEASFIWPKGRPGLLLKQEKKPETFSFLMKSWLRRNCN